VGSDGAGPLIQLGVRQDGLIGLAIEQMNKCRLIRPFLGMAQHSRSNCWELIQTNMCYVTDICTFYDHHRGLVLPPCIGALPGILLRSAYPSKVTKYIHKIQSTQ
jgi:hypothetical protein